MNTNVEPQGFAAASIDEPHSATSSSPQYCDLLIIDEMLPCDFSPFRTLEYSHYLTYFRSSALISIERWWGAQSNATFDENLADLALPSSVKAKIFPVDTLSSVVPRLAYITFLNNAGRLLPILETRQIPFVLQLYPGGGFEPNVEESDKMLKTVCASELCRKIIVTQNLSRSYLVDVIKCAPEKIEFIYGGVYSTKNQFNFYRDKAFFGKDKNTIDLCFVAHRYGNDVRKKGYDQFVAVAQALGSKYGHVRFHVVGDYSAEQIPLGDVADKFVFYGAQPNTFFKDFYRTMDIILSVNRPLNESGGAFDGFPTGACMEAGFHGVLNIISDPLNLNVAFHDDVDVIIVDFDTEKTVQRLSALLENSDRLYEIAAANWQRFVDVFATDRQLWERCRVISEQLLNSETLILRPSPPRSLIGEAAVRTLQARCEELWADYCDLLGRFDQLQRKSQFRGCLESLTTQMLGAKYASLFWGFLARLNRRIRRQH